MADVVVVGAGHNGLVAAALLARAGLAVEVLERAGVIGGACRTEHPFARAPRLAASTGAYLLGLMPPELLTELELRIGDGPGELPAYRRDPHYFLPAPDGRHLLLGADAAANRAALTAFSSAADARAADALGAELAALRTDLAPAWLAEPLTVEETAEAYVRPALRTVFVDLVRGSAMDYLGRFGFAGEEVPAMYAVTDGMPGLTGSPWTPGSGHNLLVHNMARLPGSDGTWLAVRGGMGVVTGLLAERAVQWGARLRLDTAVRRIALDGGAVSGVLTDAGVVPARAVLVAADPFRLPGLLGEACPPALAERVTGWAARSEGRTMKVNLALSGLPTFTALPERRGQHGSTVHLLPSGPDGVLGALRTAFDAAAAGDLSAIPPLEWYLSGLSDDAGRMSSALFVQGVPHSPTGSTWAAEKDGYVDRLLDVVAGYAPDIRDLLVDVHALAPPDIVDHFGITSGNIFHVDNAVSFTDRMPYRVGVDGVYAGSAGCFPAGSVIGCAGRNAAHAVLADLGMTA